MRYMKDICAHHCPLHSAHLSIDIICVVVVVVALLLRYAACAA